MLNISLNDADLKNLSNGIDMLAESQERAIAFFSDMEGNARVVHILENLSEYVQVTKRSIRNGYGKQGLKTSLKCLILTMKGAPHRKIIQDMMESRMSLATLPERAAKYTETGALSPEISSMLEVFDVAGAVSK